MVSQKLLVDLFFACLMALLALLPWCERDRRASWPLLRKPRKWWRYYIGGCIGDLLDSKTHAVLARCRLDANHPGGCMDTRKGRYWTRREPPADFVGFPLWPKEWDAPYVVAWRALWILPAQLFRLLFVVCLFVMFGYNDARGMWEDTA